MYAHNRVRRLIIGQKLTLNQLDESYNVSGRNLIPISLELSKFHKTTDRLCKHSKDNTTILVWFAYK